ncbi:MAG: hypothetical protein ACXWJ8_13470 [Xanthobacteraceae bacterium]
MPSTIAALTAALSVFAFSPLHRAANAAETCLAAPQGAAPQGGHWRYRLERGTQRKCWRLVQKDQNGHNAATQTDPQGDADDDTEQAPAAQVAKKSAGRVTPPQPKTSPALITKEASNIEKTGDTAAAAQPAATTQPVATNQPVQWPDPPASMMQRLDAPAASPPPEQTQNDAPAPAALAEQPAQQPVAAADSAAIAPAAGGTFTLRFLLAAIALLGFVVCAMFYVGAVRRRRADVLNKARHLNRLPSEVPAGADAPTFAPLPPMALIPPHDDVAEAMQRFNDRWKRRAA